MDYRDIQLEPSEDLVHLAQAHRARPMFQNPVQLMKMKMGEGLVFDVDDAKIEDDFDGEEEEVFDADTMAIFNFEIGGEHGRKPTSDYFDVDRFAHTDFLSTEEYMVPLNPEETVKKMVIREGSRAIKIPERSKLYFHYTAICEGALEAFDTSMIRKMPYSIDLRYESTIPGLILALKSMALSEIARFIMYPEMAFGEAGCPPRIPANSKVMYVIQLLQFIDEAKLNTPKYMTVEERNNLPFQTISEESTRMRGDGNRHYADKNYSQAVKKWRMAINFLEDYLVTDNNDDKTRRELLVMLYSNLAQGYLNLERPAQACNACKVGLRSADETHPACVKLLFRFAKAKLMLKDSEAALGLIKEALKIEPSNEEALALKGEILEEDNRMNIAHKKACQRMFSTGRSENNKKAGGGAKSGGGVKAESSKKTYEGCKLKPDYDTAERKEPALEAVQEETLDFDLFVKDFEYCSAEDFDKMRADIANRLRNVSAETPDPSSAITSALLPTIPKPPRKPANNLEEIFFANFNDDEEASDDEE